MHTARATQDWLSNNVPDFIRKDQWPARSPDLNPLDYCIWAVLEERVCRAPHPNVNSLRQALIEAWEELDMEMKKRCIDDFPRRLDKCVAARGGLFE